jgi:integrase/recombinase XerD
LRRAKLTVSAYVSDLHHYRTFQVNRQRDLNDVDQSAVIDYLETLKATFSNASVLRNLSVLRGFHAFIADREPSLANPTDSLPGIRKTQRLPQSIPTTEIDSLLEGEGGNLNLDRPIIDLLYSCGLRVSELVQLQLNQVFLEEGFLRILGKGNKERIVPMADATRLTYATTWSMCDPCGSNHEQPMSSSIPKANPSVASMFTRCWSSKSDNLIWRRT